MTQIKESSKFAGRKWYIINDYSDAYILVTGNITATNGDEDTKVAFKN